MVHWRHLKVADSTCTAATRRPSTFTWYFGVVSHRVRWIWAFIKEKWRANDIELVIFAEKNKLVTKTNKRLQLSCSQIKLILHQIKSLVVLRTESKWIQTCEIEENHNCIYKTQSWASTEDWDCTWHWTAKKTCLFFSLFLKKKKKKNIQNIIQVYFSLCKVLLSGL